MGREQARELFADARVARLATLTPDGRPHLVPVVFVVYGSRIYTAVDAKPKRTTALRRLANIRAEPRVSLLADHYSDDWSRLWWVRADGTARVLEDAPDALVLLAERYPQYRDQPPPGPVIAVEVQRWTGWLSGSY
ncbi:MAG: TIGR03668 family PPOX class F420-dependent oxidoreductase [Jatrophihabitantaceae bacterium]